LAKLDFKLNIDKEINKNIDIKPFLIIFFLLFLPIFYSIWTIYDYNNYSNKLEKVENNLTNKNIYLKTMNKKIKLFSLKPQIEKKLIDQTFVNDYKVKKDVFSSRTDETNFTSECMITIPEILYPAKINNKNFDLKIKSKLHISKISSKTEEIKLKNYSEEIYIAKKKQSFFSNLFGSTSPDYKIEIKFKDQTIYFDKKNQTQEIKFDSLNSYKIEIGTREAVIKYNNITKEVFLSPIIGTLTINTEEPKNMLFPIVKERNKKYLKTEEKLKNLKVFKFKAGDLPIVELMKIKVIANKKVKPINLRFYKDENNRLLLRSSFSSIEYSNFETFTEELKSKKIFNNFEIISISNKNKFLIMDILISVNMEVLQ
jgi:hypothetical protein